MTSVLCVVCGQYKDKIYIDPTIMVCWGCRDRYDRGTSGKFDDYQQKAHETAVYPFDKAREYLLLGLANEIGELAGKLKKVMRGDYGGDLYHITNEMRQSIGHELGDVLWYLAELAGEFDFNLSEIAQMNLDKLSSRQDRGVIKGDGDER